LVLSTCIPSLLVFLHWVWQLQDFQVVEPTPTTGKQGLVFVSYCYSKPLSNSRTAMPAAVLTNQCGSNMTGLSAWRVITTEYIFLLEMKQGKCVCPLSWSVHCNFTGDGKYNKRGWVCTPPPHQPGLILPSCVNVRQKAAVATLCTLW
jgi:hypothetical protein